MSDRPALPPLTAFRPGVHRLEERDVPAAAILSAAFAQSPIDEGSTGNLTVVFQTPTRGLYNLSVAWGDGTSTDLDPISASPEGFQTVQLSHLYPDDLPNTFATTRTAVVTVRDPADDPSTRNVPIDVRNVAPTPAAASPPTAYATVPFTATLATFTDPGFDNPAEPSKETFTASINWGDNTSSAGSVSWVTGSPGVPSSGSVAGTHTYSGPGTYTITVTVTDDDAGQGTVQLQVVILPPPTSTLAGRVYAEENGNTTYQAGIDLPVGGVTVKLDGVETLSGLAVHRSTQTLADGSYSFAGVFDGSYTLTELQPAGYLDGPDYIGTQGGTAGNDVLTIPTLPGGTTGTDNNFTEAIPTSLGCPTVAAPVITGISRDDGASPTDGVTSDRTLVLRGTGEPHSVITVLRGGVAVGTVQVDNVGQWSFDATGTSLGAGNYNFAVRQQSNGPLGVAENYTAFSFTDLDLYYSDTWGSLAAGNNLTVNGYGVGTRISNPPQHLTSLVAGNNLAVVNSQVYVGDAVFGNSANLYQSNLLNGAAVQSAGYIDFAAAKADLLAKSAAWAGYPPTGTTASSYGVLRLTGSRSTLNIFTVTASQLSSANTLIVSAPPGSRVLINVVGSGQVNIQNLGMQIQGVTRQDVLFNIPDATQLNISGVSVQGTILAPKANVWFTNGNVEGNLIANRISGNGQLHLYPLNVTCPVATSADYRVTVVNPATASTPPAGRGSAALRGSTFVLLSANTLGVFDADGSQKGTITLAGVTDGVGLASDGESLYVLDKATKRVVVFTGIGPQRWGTAVPKRSFGLVGATVNPTALSLEGGLLWVTDSARPGARDGYIPTSGQWVRRG